MAFDYCSTPLTDHELINCGNWVKGGVSAFAVLEEDHGITDFASASQWQDAIDAGKVKIAKQGRYELPEASDITADNPIGGATQEIVDGRTFVFQGSDSNVNATNDSFYENLNGRQTYVAWFMPKSSTILVNAIDPVTWSAKPIVPASATERQYYSVTATWESSPQVFPARYDAPAGIFS